MNTKTSELKIKGGWLPLIIGTVVTAATVYVIFYYGAKGYSRGKSGEKLL